MAESSRPHTAWVRTLGAFTDGSPSKWQAIGWGNCREEAIDALEHWMAQNPDERHEWCCLAGDETPQPRAGK